MGYPTKGILKQWKKGNWVHWVSLFTYREKMTDIDTDTDTDKWHESHSTCTHTTLQLFPPINWSSKSGNTTAIQTQRHS